MCNEQSVKILERKEKDLRARLTSNQNNVETIALSSLCSTNVLLNTLKEESVKAQLQMIRYSLKNYRQKRAKSGRKKEEDMMDDIIDDVIVDEDGADNIDEDGFINRESNISNIENYNQQVSKVI
ncbi:hypothetical protein HELRODRAFT_170203 [Helobdella robusta]|uniref:Uncharacterized protein n=1 Tax=Helobdella robusta TaxID=6412 RepID=T1F2S3_HELRO|nr:hypothetical protein HELRODRAFT_170203 [Helobdella robusta]ESO07672.1 hypothetical protein HELRODRAFT_170203 [Helobdella robusta]